MATRAEAVAGRFRYPYQPTERQAFAHRTFAQHRLFGGAAGGGKAASIDTPIPTPWGWTTMGSLRDGHIVFDEHGVGCRVVRAHEIIEAPVSYRITFDDGASLEVSADHRWLTYTAADLAALTRRNPAWRAARQARRASRVTGRRSEAFTAAVTARNRALPPPTLPPPAGAVRTTQDIADTLLTVSGRRNHAIPVAGALELPEADLPVDPYLLGLWLGDGSKSSGQYASADAELVDAFRRYGFPVSHNPRSPHAWYVTGFVKVLRQLGIFNNKHIPPAYLRSSIEDRLALLQGLMDTDGTVADHGQAEFCNTNRAIVDGVHELIVSLGWKATIRSGWATLEGRVIGPKWDIKWTPDRPVFRLGRKLARQRLATRRTNAFRYVVSCERIDPVPMRCITVDSPSGLYLAGRDMVPTHNTYWLVSDVVRSVLTYGVNALILRRTYGDLAQSKGVIETLEEMLPPEVARYNRGRHVWRFRNGATLQLGHLAHDGDVQRYVGGSYGVIGWDQVEAFTEWQYRRLLHPLRVAEEVEARGFVPHMVATANPGGPGHVWCKGRWIEPAPPNVVWQPTPTEDEPVPGTRVFLPSRVEDNPHLSEAYHRRLEGLPEDERRALRWGDWDVYAGARFGRLWRRDIHVIDPEQFPVPAGAGVPRGLGIDYGSAAPFAALWGALFPDGLVVVYRELYKADLSPAEQAAMIRAVEGPAGERVPGRPLPTWLDPSCWIRDPHRPRDQVAGGKTVGASPDRPPPGSIAGAYHAGGVPARKANNDRRSGTALIARKLQVRADGRPRLYVYRTCLNLIRTLPGIPRDSSDPELYDTDYEDHAVDALRYLLMGLDPGDAGPGRPPPPSRPSSDHLRTETAGLRRREL